MHLYNMESYYNFPSNIPEIDDVYRLYKCWSYPLGFHLRQPLYISCFIVKIYS